MVIRPRANRDHGTSEEDDQKYHEDWLNDGKPLGAIMSHRYVPLGKYCLIQ
jgi:hypothetical protein